jgi:hypothetical protein
MMSRGTCGLAEQGCRGHPVRTPPYRANCRRRTACSCRAGRSTSRMRSKGNIKISCRATRTSVMPWRSSGHALCAFRRFVVGISLSEPRRQSSWATRGRGGGILASGGAGKLHRNAGGNHALEIHAGLVNPDDAVILVVDPNDRVGVDIAARLEKMRIPKFLPSVITSLRQAGPVWGGHPHTRQRGADAEELRRFGPTAAECPDDTGACPDHAFEGVAPVDPFAFHGSKARHSAFHREDTPARPLIPGDERISSPSMWVRRGYRQEARRGTQATQHRFASQDGTIFETHNRDDRLVGPFSTEVT